MRDLFFVELPRKERWDLTEYQMITIVHAVTIAGVLLSSRVMEMIAPNVPERLTTKIYKLTAWIGAVGILGSLFVKIQAISNRQALSFFIGLFVLSITLWSQEMKRIEVRPHPVPGHAYQLTEVFIQWRWWGILLTAISAILMILPILDIFLPWLLPETIQAFYA